MKISKTSFKNKKSMSLYTSKAKLSIIGACIMLITLTSCGGSDDDPNPLNCGDAMIWGSLEAKATAWLTATLEYEANKNTANCEKNKNAAQAYLDAYISAKECVPSADLDDYEDEINDTREKIKSIICE